MSDDTPYLGMCFELSAMGISMGSFSECSGLTVEIDSEPYHEGGKNHFVYSLPKQVKPMPIVLKRGLSSSTKLFWWIRTFIETSRVLPMLVSIDLRGPGTSGDVRRTWVVDHAYPLKWEGPKLDASKGEVAIETLELAHHGIWQA